jgi:hypothetical protein
VFFGYLRDVVLEELPLCEGFQLGGPVAVGEGGEHAVRDDRDRFLHTCTDTHRPQKPSHETLSHKFV